MSHCTNIFIFRRDLRIHDNTGFIKCYRESEKIYPIFILTPEQLTRKNSYRSLPAIKFMFESLRELAKTIPLTVFYGSPAKIIKQITRVYGDINVWVNTDYTKYSAERDIAIASEVHEFHSVENDPVIYPRCGKQYVKFTPYYNRQLNLEVSEPQSIRVSVKSVARLDHVKLKRYIISDLDECERRFTDDLELVGKWLPGGRKAGLKQLKKIRSDMERKLLCEPTTRLSAYLKFGCLSPREVYYAVQDYPEILRQLIWRDFYYQLGDVSMREIAWNNDSGEFKLWCEGKTGYPVVDAAINQLNQTGYLHNRGRLIVANFLVKNLLIDWRWGAKYFAQRLIDYDPLVNDGNWKYVAYMQPYFRIPSPIIQAGKHDPDGKYIAEWLPSDAPQTPIIDFEYSRNRALKAWRK